MKNYGFNPELERQHSSEEDWVFLRGLSQPGLAIIPAADRDKYLPMGEVQKGIEDMMDCASRGPINKLEADFTYLLIKNLLTADNAKWLRDNGYVIGDKVTFSDAFIAILSGTTRQGNSLKAPLQAIHDYGLVPKQMLPLTYNMTWQEYHNPKRITPLLKNLGAEFKKRFEINYEKVYETHYETLLKDDMLVVAGYAWAAPIDGIYPSTNLDPNHVWLNVRLPKYLAFDNYADPKGGFMKQLSDDFNFLDYGYRVYVSAENLIEKQKSIIRKLLEKLGILKAYIEEHPNAKPTDEVPGTEPAPTKPLSLVYRWGKAIEEFEDYVAPGGLLRSGVVAPTGSVSWRNKNPGNIKGLIGFLKFKSYEEGWDYLIDYLVRAATGKHSAYRPDFTLLQFFQTYAPATDKNQPKVYADFVARRLEVPVETKIRNLV